MVNDNCPLGRENKTRIKGIEKVVDEMKTTINDRLDLIHSKVSKISDKWSSRPTWIVSLIITALVSAVTYFVCRS